LLIKLSVLFLLILFSPVFAQSETDYSRANNLNFEGKIIRKVTLRIINVAGPSIEDKRYDSTWFSGIINSLHYKTRPWVIRERLLFKPGDTLNLRNIYESERLLRSSNLFVDAKIKVMQSDEYPNTVEVEVITKDKWTLTYLAAYNPGSYAYLGIKDDNLLGLGHKADALITHNDDRAVSWGGRLRYTAPNLNGSYADLGFKLEANKKKSFKSLNLIRPFFTYDTEWIGGFELIWDSDKYQFFTNESELNLLPVKKNIQDFWAGKSFTLDPEDGSANTNLIVAGRLSGLNYSERPFDPVDYRIFENSTIYLAGAGIISRSFYKDRFVEGFGITEDIPLGYAVTIAAGFEKRELSDRWYFGFESIHSTFIQTRGYLSGRFGFGVFRNINTWEQTTYNLNIIYHSLLFENDNWKYRFFSNFDVLLGYKRISGEEIHLSSHSGLRGIDMLLVRGTKRTVLNLETRIFSPYELLGFIIGGIAFTDFGLIAKPTRSFFSSRFYQAYGFGLRIRNESIVTATFGLSLAFNPYNPRNNGARFTVLFSTSISLGIRQIGYSKPFIEGFGDY
jgi:hypothetical protein